jgi:hypothetical protein
MCYTARVILQLCKRSVDRLGAAAGPMVATLREQEHEVQLKDCLGRCTPCQAGQLIFTADGMPLMAPDPARLVALTAELAAGDD